MSEAAQAQETLAAGSITLKGSAQLVSEFFYFGMNSILYQRGVYPAQSFKRTQKYGLTVFVPNDSKLDDFFTPLLQQVSQWLVTKELQRLVVVIRSVKTEEVLERWQFNVETDETVTDSSETCTREKSPKQIQKEIGDIIRQITASVTFLPLLDTLCSFDVLMYTRKNASVPEGWADSDPCYVQNGQEVRLRSFSTLIHTVDTKVTYKGDL